jgi:hypothetical protein
VQRRSRRAAAGARPSRLTKEERGPISRFDDESIDRRLAELGSATQGIAARPGFNAKVMLAIQAQPPGFWGELLASSRWVLGVATLAAIAAVGFAWRAESSANEAVAVAYDTTELPW